MTDEYQWVSPELVMFFQTRVTREGCTPDTGAVWKSGPRDTSHRATHPR